MIGTRRSTRSRTPSSGEWLRRLRLSALSAACGVGLAAALWWGAAWALQRTTAHPYFALATITVEGNRRLSRNEVLQWAQVSEGTSIWDATPGVVRMRLQSHPWIDRVVVERELPRRLRIEVRERRPVAVAQLDTLNYVDGSGHVLGPLREDDSRDFPIITGLDGTASAGFTGIGLHRALQLLRCCERLSYVNGISEIHVDRYRGVTIFPLRPAVAVVLGWGSWRDKLARLNRVFVAWEGQAGRLARVDVSFHDLVVVKLRDDNTHPTAGRSPKRGMRV